MQNKNRKSIRIKDFDYSEPGDYFITICTQDRECLFGKIVDEEMVLNKIGKIVEKCYLEIPKHFRNIELDIFQVMPNHIHFIIRILCEENIDSECRGLINQTPTKERDDRWILMRSNKITLGKIIRSFKAKATFLAHRKDLGLDWQRNYYEEIIKDEKHYDEVYTYIQSNPQTWDRDRNNPKNSGK